MIERALIIKQPWIDLILSGKKTWEMRSRPTHIRGKIGLIEQGTGLIVGEADLFGVVEFQDIDLLASLSHNHCIYDEETLEKWNTAWMLKNAKRYDKPTPYNHPQGAVVWVKLDKESNNE
ncbi:ASCH domain-containing protein [Thiomicrorhabdus lithotrophica]|uniref:ASCH domain-containing protein n=1 Tax=Thiomicrorhabdus lithotrophica TaxID=2949997 RepID=A0ABY8CCR5_9GAMM|nr:ASCH domain-containing protein [Thiomicrorhabdus lithotrophica]WEJ62188.1 ASCH domain-containing protein [Thiomicrorhabdus lithotrophica]